MLIVKRWMVWGVTFACIFSAKTIEYFVNISLLEAFFKDFLNDIGGTT